MPAGQGMHGRPLDGSSWTMCLTKWRFLDALDSRSIIELRDDIFTAGRTSPDVVMINCGSNNLCYGDCDLEAVANGLILYANLLKISFGLKLVVIVCVINRDRCRAVTRRVFRNRVHELNHLLEEKIAEYLGIDFQKLRGYYKSADGHLDLPVAS